MGSSREEAVAALYGGSGILACVQACTGKNACATKIQTDRFALAFAPTAG